MPEQIPIKDPRFKGKRYEIQLPKGHPRLIQESAEVCAIKIQDAERLMGDFETTHNLQELHAITGFSSREERLASPRQAALEALKPMFSVLKFLKSQEAVPESICAVLEARYKRFNRAVGAIEEDSTGKMFELVGHDN